MLRAEIVLMKEGDTEILVTKQGDREFLHAWCYGENDRWKDRTLALAALATDDEQPKIEVFIILRTKDTIGQPDDLLNRVFTSKLIRTVRQNIWGNLYVVIDKRIQIEKLLPDIKTLNLFLTQLSEAGATDILQVQLAIPFDEPTYDFPDVLKQLTCLPANMQPSCAT